MTTIINYTGLKTKAPAIQQQTVFSNS